MMLEARMTYSMVSTAASCTVVMHDRFTIYITHAEIGTPSYWYRAIQTPDRIFLYPFILWSDVRARILIGDHAWATVLIGSEGKPVVQDAYGVVFTVEVLDKQAEKQEGEQEG